MNGIKYPVLQETPEFLADLASSIAQAKKRIWIEVMIFEITAEMEKYIALLIDAVNRGVDVWITVDWISERYYGEDLDTLPTFHWAQIKKRQIIHEMAEDMLARLQKEGVHLVIDKVPNKFTKHILIGHRNHNKLFIIDDILWTGGINFIASPYKTIDFMVKLYDQRLVTVIENYFKRKPQYDLSIQSTPTYCFLADSGKRWNSIIYDTALRLISESKSEIILVSQLLPDSRFLNTLLQKSFEHVHITIIISHKDHNIFTRFPFRIHLDSFMRKIKQNDHINIVHANKKIHAKLLVVDKKKAIFGSHNFASWNELIGIEETGFLTKDEKLIKQFIEFARKI